MIGSSFLYHKQDPKGFSKEGQKKSHDTYNESRSLALWVLFRFKK
jgi:hypothetical protein